ncbi:MAG: ribonuclease III [Ruminococcaceae bacterium]|nr:ribonuclease III [Oscillospiraceae bacterium]
MKYDLEMLEKSIGYKFNKIELLSTALTHSSFSNEQKAKGIPCECNERLEFLGDAILSMITSEYIFTKYPDTPEGDLSKLRAEAVEGDSEKDYSRKLNVGEYLILGKGEELSGGRTKKKLLEDAFEAIVAAIYLDGGYDAACNFVLPFITDKLDGALTDTDSTDYKTKLQILIQKEGPGEHLEYRTVSEYGPDHNKTFEVEVKLNSNVIGHGKGPSIKHAEKAAAKDALRLFGIK